MHSGNLMAGDGGAMGTMTFQNGLTLNSQNGPPPSWTLKIDGNGNSDSLDFGYTPGVTDPGSHLAISGSSTLVVTGCPLPATGVPYTIVTDDHVSSFNLNNVTIKAPWDLRPVWAPRRGLQTRTSRIT